MQGCKIYLHHGVTLHVYGITMCKTLLVICYNKGKDLVTNMVAMGNVVEKRKRKFLQYVAFFWLLKQDHPLIDFDFEATKCYTKTLAL